MVALTCVRAWYLVVCRYEGDWLNDLAHGNGTKVYSAQGGRYPDGTRYVGPWKCGKCCGKGELVFPDGSKYVGDFVNDNRDGRGLMTWPSGDEYNGMVRRRPEPAAFRIDCFDCCAFPPNASTCRLGVG